MAFATLENVLLFPPFLQKKKATELAVFDSFNFRACSMIMEAKKVFPCQTLVSTTK
jgi:hypothetical protein